MERRLKERLIGAAVLVMLAVIFIPMILDDSSRTDVTITETNIPDRPDDSFNSRIVPLHEDDLRSVNDEVQGVVEEQPVLSAQPQQRQASQAEPELQSEPQQEQEIAQEPDNSSAPELPPSVPPQQTTANNKHMGATAWVVQLGSFNSEENARGLNDKLRKAGYPAFVEPLKRATGIVYRVRVGPELLRSNAQALQDKLRDNMQIEGIVIRYP